MRCNLRSAAVEGQRAPAFAEGRNAAVTVLDTEQPARGTTGSVDARCIRIANPGEANPRAGRVVRVRYAAAQGRPRPGSGPRMGKWMLATCLLRQQPTPRAGAGLLRQRTRCRQSTDRQGGHPRREIRVDRPTPIRPTRLDEKRHTGVDNRTVGLVHPCQAHHDEAGERRRFEIAAALRLHGPKKRVRRVAHTIAQDTGHWIFRRREMMAYLTDRDERGERVADDREAKVLKPAVRKRRELERKLWNQSPRVLAQLAGQREHGEDRNRKRLVLAVSTKDRQPERNGRQVSGGIPQPSGGAGNRALERRLLRCDVRKGGPYNRRRADVARTSI